MADPNDAADQIAELQARLERFEELLKPVAPAVVSTQPPTWSESLLSWKHQGVTANVLAYSVLGCLLQQVLGTTSYDQLIETLTAFASSLGYSTPGALIVAVGCAIKARRARS